MRKKFSALWTRVTETRRKGMTLVELLGVMVVIAILSVIAIGGISAARDNANRTSVVSDVRTFENSIKQMLMIHPDIMKYNPEKPAHATDVIIGYLNDQVEEEWAFEPIAGTGATKNTKSGAVACTTIKRDAWGNAYCMYIYFDELATTYVDKDGTNLKDSDSCVYIVIASPGKNGTGVGSGITGNNFDVSTGKLVDPNKCVNNTDGIDDIGLIVRIRNGDVYSATFGTDKALLGELKGVQWIFGRPNAGTGGFVHDFTGPDGTEQVAGAGTAGIAMGGSIDYFYDNSRIKSVNDGLTGGLKIKWIGHPTTAGQAYDTIGSSGGGDD